MSFRDVVHSSKATADIMGTPVVFLLALASLALWGATGGDGFSR